MGLRDKGVRSLAAYQDAMSGEIIVDLNTSLVDEMKQIRTVYDPEREAEFAAMLRMQGQQSPAIVRPNPEQPGRYIVVYGHRRLRACVTNKVPVKAVVREMTEDDAWAIQWSENIDRENLTPLEIGRGIQEREALLGSLSKVAEVTGKTVAWLSKYRRFAEAYDAEGPARALIDSGASASVDTITEVFALQTRNDAGAQRAEQLVSEIQANPTLKVRDRVRELSDDAKEQAGKPRSKPKPTHTLAPEPGDQTKAKPAAPHGSVSDLLQTVYQKLIEEKNGTARKALNAIGEEGKEKIERALKRMYAKGHMTTDADYTSVVVSSLLDGSFGKDGPGLFNFAAFMEGKLGEKDGFDLSTVLNKAKTDA